MKGRTAIAALTISATAFVGLLSTEGYRGEAYKPTPYDVPTIGFGTTGGVKMGDKTNPVAALKRAREDIETFEGYIKSCVKVPLHQGEFDLYTRLTYNIGPGNFCSSTIVKLLNQQKYGEACEQILRWKYHEGYDCSTPGNKICSGLWKTRLEIYGQCVALQK